MEKRSKYKLILKVLLVFAAVVVLLSAGAVAFIIYHLPSRNILSSAILNPAQRENLAMVNDTTVATQTMQEPPSVLNPNIPSSATTEVKQMTTLSTRAGLDDLINPNRPISNFCSSLRNAKAGAMTEQETNRAFQLSLDEATADPRAQALKPLFRYILRLPQLQDLINEVNTAAASGQLTEESFTDKAAFYGKVAAAFMAMNTHKSDFEAIADRSYLFYNLNKAVALNPALAADERLRKFCDDTENLFNAGTEVNIDQEKKNFERLLAELNVDQKSIGYNPDYKTTFDIKRDSQSLRLTGGWIEEAFDQKK